MSLQRKLRSWFFTVTSVLRPDHTIGGIRFLKFDQPSEETMRTLMNSVTLPAESEDRARVSASGSLQNEQGLAVLANDAQAKTNVAQLTDRSLVTQPHQLPTVENSTGNQDSLIDFVGDALSITADATTTRNRYIAKLSSPFKTWLSDTIIALQANTLPPGILFETTNIPRSISLTVTGAHDISLISSQSLNFTGAKLNTSLGGTSSTYAERWVNSTAQRLFDIRNDAALILNNYGIFTTTTDFFSMTEYTPTPIGGCFYVNRQAGAGNTGIYSNLIGVLAGTSNTGAFTNALGLNAGQNNIGDYLNAFGSGAGLGNHGLSVNAFGSSAGTNNTGSNSNFNGNAAGLSNSGSYVNGFGTNAGKLNTGNNCSFFGKDTGTSNTGSNVIAFGEGSAISNIGSECVFLGSFSGWSQTGSYCHFLGYFAGYQNSGTSIIGIGINAGKLNTVNNCVFIGDNAGLSNSGGYTIAIGNTAGQNNTGVYSSFIGFNAGYQNTKQNTTAIGALAAYQNTGADNTSIGANAGYINTGDSSVFAGSSSGFANSGANCVFIGNAAGYQNTGATVYGIGAFAAYQNTGNSVFAVGQNSGQANNLSNVMIFQGYNNAFIGQGTNQIIGLLQSMTIQNTMVRAGGAEPNNQSASNSILRLAQARGSGTAAPGAIIIQKAVRTASGNTQHTLSDFWFFDADGNTGIGGQSYGSGKGAMFLATAATAPTTNPVGGFLLYVDPADNKLKARGPSGTVTILAIP